MLQRRREPPPGAVMLQGIRELPLAADFLFNNYNALVVISAFLVSISLYRKFGSFLHYYVNKSGRKYRKNFLKKAATSGITEPREGHVPGKYLLDNFIIAFIINISCFF